MGNRKSKSRFNAIAKTGRIFEITIDSLFYINEDENILSEDSANILKQNSSWWAGIHEADMTTTALPHYGFLHQQRIHFALWVT